ncbi:MAG: hypothetical protein MUO42_11885 [Anaerolineaceae bacterium]|nr:hypothetical protein [Anaerolineaceae bacterium]
MGNSVSELNPLMRTLVVVILVTVPILLVILQRLPEIRKIINQPKQKDLAQKDEYAQFNLSSRKDVVICPKCFRQNPPDHKFCGFCGSELTFPKKEN